MHLKFLPHGKGSARAAVDYLVGERDAEGHRREGVEVVRGNPDMVAAVADSLEFERRYTSAVIAWAPEDRPTDEQIEAVLDEFEKTAWAGLEPDRYAWTAVLHRERGGGVHAHVLAAQCDLETGRSLNIAPPGWQRTFDPLRDAFNHEHGWSRPDDPERARAQQPGHRAYVEASKLRAGDVCAAVGERGRGPQPADLTKWQTVSPSICPNGRPLGGACTASAKVWRRTTWSRYAGTVPPSSGATA